MHKIFINDKPFILAGKSVIPSGNEGAMIIARSELQDIKQAVDVLKLDAVKTLTITGDVEIMWKEFLNNYKLIEAAGGVVKNAENKLLFIFRLGKWDLPKGKVDKGETLEQAAIREVEEECGIGKLEITGKIITTYHTYSLKDKEIVKASHWFAMNTNDNSPLIAQTEENITEARWVPQEEIPTLLKEAYPSIAEVILKTQ